jgi:hypothetical protein
LEVNLGSSLVLTTVYYTVMVGYLRKTVGSAKGGKMNRFMKYVYCVCVCVRVVRKVVVVNLGMSIAK